jgi:hypothetical protein
MRPTIALLFLLACKGQVGYERKEVETTGGKLFEEVTGVKPDSFTCPGEDERLLGKMTCTAKVGDQSVEVEVLIKGGEGGLMGKGQMNINVQGVVLAKQVNEVIIERTKGKQPEVTAVKCPPVTKLVEGGKFTCPATVGGMEMTVEIIMTKDGWNWRIIPPEGGAPPAPDPTTVGPQP